MPEMFEHEIEIPHVGLVTLRATKEQIEKLIKTGKQAAINAIDENDRSNYVYRDSEPVLRDVSGGIVGGDQDWNAVFPDISEEEIQELIDNATKDTSKKTKQILSLIEIGLMDSIRDIDIYDLIDVDIDNTDNLSEE